MAKRRILRSGHETAREHRGDLESCPFCAYKRKPTRWIHTAHVLCLHPRFDKCGCASILTKCPKCSRTSWVHIDLDGIDCYELPTSWKDAAKKESVAQKLAALRQWGACLCWKCSRLTAGNITHHAWRTCEHGMGPAEASCPLFRPVETVPDTPSGTKRKGE